MKLIMVFLLGFLLLGSLVVAGQAGYKSRWVTVTCTAYCPCKICCASHSDGVTASGRNAWLAGVAVDPAVFALGSHLDIPGYDRGPNGNGSWILADDTGRLVVGNVIDVRFKTHEEAVQWGRKTLKVRVWEKESGE